MMSHALRPVFTNRLVGEKSPYLRQHAHNPVDWFPWGEEAFAKAGAEQKPIFLSIGYSTCHWCHVMAHESFENEAVAAALNRDFVPVKVDREERPDVDRVYMTYVQAATGQGGWPMSVWLTPGLKPFYGGTYFPPEDRWGRPGFLGILTTLAQAWATRREQLLAEGDRVAEALRQYSGSQNTKRKIPYSKDQTQHPDPEDRIVEPDFEALVTAGKEACQGCFRQLADSYDAGHGGFGGAPKFPRAAVFNFLFRTADDPGAESVGGGRARQMATQTLRKMAEGGIHDHVGGGFHRYSVDDEWFVPHFEKMLYDQAQLAVSYLEARQATGDERYAWVARGILDYVMRDLAHPDGGFYSAEDADSPLPSENPAESRGSNVESRQAEGAFYVWRKDEIANVLEDDADLFCFHFGVEDGGNVPRERDPHGDLREKNHLRQRQPLAATAQQFALDPEEADRRLSACLVRLQQVRARRPRPHLDNKIITAWNGLMISALAKGSQVLAGSDGKGGPPTFAKAAAGRRGRSHASADEGERERQPRPGRGQRVDYLAVAVRAAEFLQRESCDEATGLLRRSFCEGRGNVPGLAEDYAYLIQGLLDLYEASFDIRWLQWAGQLQSKMSELFWDADRGGYFNSRAEDRSIIARLKESYDGAEPAPSSVAALNLLRLDAMIGSRENLDSGGLGHAERALQCLAAFRSQWETAPHSLPQMLCALACLQSPPRTIVIAGDPRAGDFRALAAVAHERLGTRQVLLAADEAEGQAWLAVRRPHVAEMRPIGGRAAAYVCENLQCQQPVTDPEALRRMVWG
jgi:uncharacterized protein